MCFRISGLVAGRLGDLERFAAFAVLNAPASLLADLPAVAPFFQMPRLIAPEAGFDHPIHVDEAKRAARGCLAETQSLEVAKAIRSNAVSGIRRNLFPNLRS